LRFAQRSVHVIATRFARAFDVRQIPVGLDAASRSLMTSSVAGWDITTISRCAQNSGSLSARISARNGRTFANVS